MLLVRNYVQQISDYIPKMYKALVVSVNDTEMYEA